MCSCFDTLVFFSSSWVSSSFSAFRVITIIVWEKKAPEKYPINEFHLIYPKFSRRGEKVLDFESAPSSLFLFGPVLVIKYLEDGRSEGNGRFELTEGAQVLSLSKDFKRRLRSHKIFLKISTPQLHPCPLHSPEKRSLIPLIFAISFGLFKKLKIKFDRNLTNVRERRRWEENTLNESENCEMMEGKKEIVYTSKRSQARFDNKWQMNRKCSILKLEVSSPHLRMKKKQTWFDLNAVEIEKKLRSSLLGPLSRAKKMIIYVLLYNFASWKIV